MWHQSSLLCSGNMKTALRVQNPPSGTQMTTLGSVSSGIPSRFHLDNYGDVSAEVYELPDDPDGQVAVTVSLMNRYAVEDCRTVKVNDALTLACRFGRQLGLVCTRLDDLIAAIHLYVRRSCRFVHDEVVARWMSRFERRPIVEVLLRPTAMLHFRAGDCDDFAMLVASLLLAAGIPCTFAAVAADDRVPQDFSHVYVVAYANGRRVAVDASHGEYAGWEVENRFGKRAEWALGTGALQ